MAMRERSARHRPGRHLIDRAHMRFAPPIDASWNGTFNLRWSQHVEHEHEKASPRGDSGSRLDVRGRPADS